MESFVVIGLGRFGTALARELYRMGHEVLVVDKDEDAVHRIADSVSHAVTADARDEQVLRSIGVRNFDYAVVAFADNIQDNILITLMLKELGVKHVIAKGNDDLHVKVLRRIGADRIVFPEADTGARFAQLISSSNIIDYIDISEDYSIVEVGAPEKWCTKTIRQIDVRAKYGINILAVKTKQGQTINVSPGPDYVITYGDVLVVIGANDDIKKLV
ncbi:potassium channel family protein [Acidaminobacterium chupaoyuni]